MAFEHGSNDFWQYGAKERGWYMVLILVMGFEQKAEIGIVAHPLFTPK